MQDTLNSKKKGDVAFRHKDFRVAIDCYTQVGAYIISPRQHNTLQNHFIPTWGERVNLVGGIGVSATSNDFVS